MEGRRIRVTSRAYSARNPTHAALTDVGPGWSWSVNNLTTCGVTGSGDLDDPIVGEGA